MESRKVIISTFVSVAIATGAITVARRPWTRKSMTPVDLALLIAFGSSVGGFLVYVSLMRRDERAAKGRAAESEEFWRKRHDDQRDDIGPPRPI